MSTTTTRPTKNLHASRHQVYAVSCATCHPDTDRIVILFEKPSPRNKGQGLSVSGRFKQGKYYGVMTGDVLPIVFEETVWMESPHCEGPFFIGNTTNNTIATNVQTDMVFHTPRAAAAHVNEKNMLTMGNPTYTVVDVNGILIDHEGFYTKHCITPQQ